MSGAIAVLNAGSSSLKFSVFVERGDELELIARGQAEGLYTAPRFVAKDGDGKGSRREILGRREQARPRRRARSSGRIPAHRVRRASPGGHRPSRGPRRSRIYAARSDRRSDPGRTGKVRPARAAAPAAQSRADPGAARALAGAAAGRVLRHVVSQRRAGGGAGVRAAQADHRPRRAPVRLSRALVRVHRDGAAAARSRARRAARRSSCTSATAPACARSRAVEASPARWASPPRTGCRWARAAATSIPA